LSGGLCRLMLSPHSIFDRMTDINETWLKTFHISYFRIPAVGNNNTVGMGNGSVGATLAPLNAVS
jgi:hypothetical protein